MRDCYRNSIKLSSILYVFKLKINLLSKRRIYKKDLQRSFDNKNLYIYNKQEKQIIEILECKDVYIVERIVNNLDKFVLLLAMQRNILLAFLAIYSLKNFDNLTNLDYFVSYINVIYYKNKINVNYN